MADDMMNSMMGGDWLIILILFILLGGGGMGFGGGKDYATASQVYDATNQQTINSKLADIQNAITSSAYENASLINGASSSVTNALNLGFSNVGNQIGAMNTDITNKISECCCSLKTLILENRLADTQNQLNLAQIAASNAVQTQNIIAALKPTTTTTA